MSLRPIIIFGTRPEFIKLLPIIIALKKNNIKHYVCFTGQHEDLVNVIMRDFKITFSHKFKSSNNIGSLNLLSSSIINEVNDYLLKAKPSIVIVQGDTATAVATSFASFNLNIPVAHVEAGLRTFDKLNPYPEEIYRQIISRISDFNFCPTKISQNNLLKEGIKKTSTYISGNTVIDCLKLIKKKYFTEKYKNIFAKNFIKKYNFDINKQKFVFVTFHRRENQGKNLTKFINIIKSLSKKYSDYTFIIPVHSNPKIKKPLVDSLFDINNINLLDPLSYIDCLYLISKSVLIITDSGGLQEEAPSFNKYVIVLRKVTERVESVNSGYSFLTNLNKKLIFERFDQIINMNNKKIITPYGRGNAAELIVKFLQKKIN